MEQHEDWDPKAPLGTRPSEMGPPGWRACRAALIQALERPSEEMLKAFEREFTRQLQRSRAASKGAVAAKASEPSAELAGLRALIRLACESSLAQGVLAGGGEAARPALAAWQSALEREIEEPDAELMRSFQDGFARQLKRRKHASEPMESAERAAARALLGTAFERSRMERALGAPGAPAGEPEGVRAAQKPGKPSGGKR